MNARWIILVYILKIHLKAITSQHHHHHHHYYDDTLQQYDDEDDPDESEELSSEYITRRRTKLRKESEECSCSCDSCFSREGPKACCIEFCKYCHQDTAILNQNQYANPGQKVVFVPFPYPLIVPNNAQNDEATEKFERLLDTQPVPVTQPVTEPATQRTMQLETTTDKKPEPITKEAAGSETAKLPQSVKPIKSKLRTKSVEVGMLSRHRQLKQLNPAVKRTKPAWVPKYGIVPIPDHLAAKLMTQLTEVRALKAKRL